MGSGVLHGRQAEVDLPRPCRGVLVLRPADFAAGGAAELFRDKAGWRIAWSQPLRGRRPWTASE